MQDPLAGIPATHTDPHDANITIMPPPGGSYTPYNYNYNPTQQQMYPQQNPSEQQTSPYATDNNLPFPSEEDWLTLDLNPLLESNGLGGGDPQWFGAFGPETSNNLEVLGKLINESQWPPGDMGFQ